MKTGRYQQRFYRDWVGATDLYLTHIVAKETDLQVFTDKKIDSGYIERRVLSYRWDIEDYISKDHRFLTALRPLEIELDAPAIVKKMSQAAKLANVGPMAAVAGAIAEFLGRDLTRKGYKDIIVENGGDIFLKTTKTRKVGIYAGRAKIWNNLRLKIKPQDTPLGICTSSGTIGHSLNFGCADCVVILSGNTVLADAVATATANRVKSKDDLKNALDFAKSVRGIVGAAIILTNNLISWGKIELVK